MRAADLDEAIELQNAIDYGLTAGLHSLDRRRDRALAGRASRPATSTSTGGITGAIVQRQPFGGWKRSAVGAGAKAGGPNYAAASARCRRPPSTSPPRERSYAAAWAAELGREHDPSGLRSETNLFRYRPLRHVLVRLGADTPDGRAEAALAAARQAGVRVTVSEADEPVAELAARLPSLGVDRLRLLTTDLDDDAAPLDDLRRACHAADIPVDATPISAEGRFELVHWCREQSVSITTHRYGRITSLR